MDKKIKHFMYVPFTGLGLYGGWRGERWFRNRLKIFKQFVIPSLLNQTCKDFTVWISFTREQKGHPLIKELDYYLESLRLNHVFTYSGVCFYDDKYPLKEAGPRLIENLHGSIGELLDEMGEVDEVLMTIQPSDDCYYSDAVMKIQQLLSNDDVDAVGFTKGYIMNYQTKEVSEYNPLTNPPFYTIKFKREVFANPLDHARFTALKKDVNQYPAGTPLPSHEYVGDCLRYETYNFRGFLVGTHGENISTYYNHPFKGNIVDDDILEDFGLASVPGLKINISLRKKLLKLLPHKYQKKLRYFLGEKIWNKVYEYLRS